VAYALELDEEGVRQFIRNHPDLGREGKNRLFTHLDVCLRVQGDYYINNARRLPARPDCFVLDVVMPTPPPDGPFRLFWFVVSDAAAAFGVLRVLYAEEGGVPPMRPPK